VVFEAVLAGLADFDATAAKLMAARFYLLQSVVDELRAKLPHGGTGPSPAA
jgi:hypothetical protein